MFERPWSNFQFGLSTTKVGLLFLFTFLCCTNWRKELEFRVGCTVIWMNRIFVLILLIHEAYPESTSETQTMFLLVLEMMLGAVITPTFCEYVSFCVAFALIKPASLLIFGEGPLASAGATPPGSSGTAAEPISQALAQHAILLFIAAGVNYRTHSDRRRIWLLSLSASRQSSSRRRQRPPGDRRRPPQSSSEAAAHVAEDEDEDDGADDDDAAWIQRWCAPVDPPPSSDAEQEGAPAPAPAPAPADWDELRKDGYFNAEELVELAELVREERREIRRRALDVFAADGSGGGAGVDMRWHHAKDIVGAGSFGYVYQASTTPLSAVSGIGSASSESAPAQVGVVWVRNSCLGRPLMTDPGSLWR